MIGAGSGAALMYWFDPDKGRRRRALVRGRASHVARVERELLGKALRDLDHRRQGLAHWGRSLFTREAAADSVVAERVRATLGRHTSHPRSIEVSVKDGVATLEGPILNREADDLIEAVVRVHGVARVEDQLVRHEQPGNVPGLQGEGLRAIRRRQRPYRDDWMPGPRVLAAGLGTVLGLAGLARRGAVGQAAALGGALLTVRALSNRSLRALLSQTHDEPGALKVSKTVTIDAPVEEVYSYFRNFENFARFMDHVDEVHAENAHSTWKVRGPAGKRVGFEVEIVRDQPSRLIEWRTLSSRGFEHSGTATFEPRGSTTQLSLEIRYSVPGGALGNFVAALFRADPKRVLDADLLRFKSLLEGGKTRAHRQSVTREDLRAI